MIDLARELCRLGACVDGQNCSEDTDALRICAKRGFDKLAEVVIANSNAKIDNSGKNGKTALWFAVQEGHEKMVELLLKNGADPRHKAFTQSILTVCKSDKIKDLLTNITSKSVY